MNMHEMRTLSSILDEVKQKFPDGTIAVDFDRDNYDEIVISVRTGLVEPADGQQLHTVAEIVELGL